MTETAAPEDCTELGPGTIDQDNIMYWSKHYKELKGEKFSDKSKKFVKLRLIRYVGDDNEYSERASFLCLPINGEDSVIDEYTDREFKKIPAGFYNKTIYTITNKAGRFCCNCQGWNNVEEGKGAIDPRSDGCQCSHVLALYMEFKLDLSIRFKNKIIEKVET